MNKNVCIVHFNTPVLTAHLVKSINKHTPGTHIYIFDNSDVRPFVNTFANVTVFDNTKGQIINFNQWLKKYPNKDKSGGKANKWGSAKHAYSVEKCMELINEPFVLFDSDVLVKKDFTPLFDDIVCYKGEVINQPGTNNRIKRVLPFICFINTPLCFQKGIHYFDENYMHGLRVGQIGDRYDTGAAIYLLTEKKKAPHREIKVADYIVHYGNGSWVDAAEKMKKPKHIPAGEWLRKYKEFWSDYNEEKAEKLTFDETFDHIYCLHYLPAENRLPKIKEELERVGIDETADYFSWVYDYPTPLLDLVYKDNRLNMDIALRASGRNYIKRVSMKHYEIIKEAYSLGYKNILVMEDDIRFHRDFDFINEMLSNVPDADVVMFDKMVCSAPSENNKYIQYVKSLPEHTLYGSMNDSGVFFIFCSCYSLNRTGMKKIIELHEKNLLPPDSPFNDKSLTGMFAITNLAIQDPKLKTRENESYNRIGLDTNNYFLETEPTRLVIKVNKSVPHTSKPLPKKPITGTGTKINIQPKEAFTPIRNTKPLPKQIAAPPTKKNVLPNKKKSNRAAILFRKTTGFNKLYDV